MRLDYLQLIDRIVEVDTKARTIHSEASVPQASTIFEGHFPGYPILPGVMLIEAMAQTAGWLIIAMTGFERMPFLAAVKEAKLRRFVPPGQQLTFAAALTHEGSGYAVATAKGMADREIVCEAQITFRVVAFPAPELRGHMESLAQRLGFPQRALADG